MTNSAKRQIEVEFIKEKIIHRDNNCKVIASMLIIIFFFITMILCISAFVDCDKNSIIILSILLNVVAIWSYVWFYKSSQNLCCYTELIEIEDIIENPKMINRLTSSQIKTLFETALEKEEYEIASLLSKQLNKKL